MCNSDTEICVCNSITAGEIAESIKENDLKTLQEVLDNEKCLVGDKCESCIDEGFHNDGINIPLVLAMVKRSQL